MIQNRQVRVFAMGTLLLLVAGCAQEQAPATQAPAGPDALVVSAIYIETLRVPARTPLHAKGNHNQFG